MSENTTPRGNFLYASQLLAPNSSPYGRTSSGSTVTQMPLSPFHLQSNDQCFQSDTHPIVKTEASTSHAQKFHYPLLRGYQAINQQQQGSESSSEVEAIKAKIIAHPQYSNLLEAYMDCQKVIVYINRRRKRKPVHQTQFISVVVIVSLLLSLLLVHCICI